MNINKKIKETKARIKELTQHFRYSDEIISLLTICYIAITTFDKDIADILEEVLSTRYILINSGWFDSVLEEYYHDIYINQDNYILPSFDNERAYKNDFIVIRRESSHLISRDTCDILDSLLHEIKHAMNSIINSYKKTGNKGIFYCGLSSVGEEETFELLDEAFNSYLTKIYLRIIALLTRENIEDEQIRKILEQFNLNNYKYSYTRVTKLLEPLFCNTKLFTLFYNAALYKDYKPLYERLENLLGDDIFYVLEVLLEDYFYDNSDEILKYFRTLKLKKRELEIKVTI